MKAGDLVYVELAGKRLEGRLELASSNGRSIAVSFEEGVPAPFHVHHDGRQYLLLMTPDGQDVSDEFTDIEGGRRVTVRAKDLYDVALEVTDEQFGDGTYAESNAGHPDPGVQAAIARWRARR